MKKHIITLTGFPGSGKSSTAKRLAAQLGYEHFSSGDLMREIGQRHGLSIEETNRAAEKDPAFDKEVDETIRHWGQGDKRIIDTRIAFHWIPQSFKVMLDLDPHVAAQRTFAQIAKEGRYAQKGGTAEEVYENLLARIASECKRYKDKYDIDYRNPSNYDLIVDTGKYPLEEVVHIVKTKYQEWLNTPAS